MEDYKLQMELALETKRKLDILRRATKPDGFPVFLEHIFSQSLDIFKNQHFTGGAFPNEIAIWLNSEKRTLRVSAKDHFKSMSFYAHIMWKILMLRFNKVNREIQYFSYKESMAAYHTAKIKTAISCNPYFEDIIDLKGQAESVLSYSWDGRKKLTVTPRGLLEFKRGIHCHDVYVDDPFQDPESKLVPTKITKINTVMKTQILDMYQNECHIAGTAQTNHDFFFDKDFTSRFSVKILPAMVDRVRRIALWPEWMNFTELEAKEKERGQKVFNQEYLCSPVYSENAYIEKEKLYSVVKPDNRNYTFDEWRKKDRGDYDRIGGWDLGKKNHPAHFVVYEKRNGKRIQIHDKWFDHVDYKDQMAYIMEAIECFGMYKVFYDCTRGELEMMEENGTLAGEFEGVHFTFKGKHAMAAAFDQAIGAKEIELLDIPRSLNQILIVNNDLQAPTTPEGHGDSFWSNSMSFRDIVDEGVDISVV